MKENIQLLKVKTAQIYLAMKAKETPWYAKAMAFLTIAYALSPIDLIPDFIPIIGYLDDLLILPVLIYLTIKLIPKTILIQFEEQAKTLWQNQKPVKWYYIWPIILIWTAIIIVIIVLISK